jgi:Fe-S-cluster containining protein
MPWAGIKFTSEVLVVANELPTDRMSSYLAISCAGCGACCLHMGTPPGFALFYPPAGKPMAPWAKDSEDYALWRRLPAALNTALRRYYDAVQAGRMPDRTAGGLDLPCLWFYADTRRCRHYAYRPIVCRQFEPGCAACLEHRIRRGLPVRPAASQAAQAANRKVRLRRRRRPK